MSTNDRNFSRFESTSTATDPGNNGPGGSEEFGPFVGEDTQEGFTDSKMTGSREEKLTQEQRTEALVLLLRCPELLDAFGDEISLQLDGPIEIGYRTILELSLDHWKKFKEMISLTEMTVLLDEQFADPNLFMQEEKDGLREFVKLVFEYELKPDSIARGVTLCRRFIAERMQQREDAVEPGCYFRKKVFVPVALVRKIRETAEICQEEFLFGLDPEKGTGLVMHYHGGVWHPAVDIETEAHARLKNMSTPARVEQVRKLFDWDVPRIPWDQWNTHRLLINCGNGMLDPRTLKLLDHDPKYRSTMQIPHDWNPSADYGPVPTWLKKMLPKDCLELVRQILGYLLTPCVVIKNFFILEGNRNTGKTLLVCVVQGLLGHSNTVIIEMHDFADNRFSTARLDNKLLAVYDDLSSGRIDNTTVIKMLTGGSGQLVVERKGQNAYDTQLYARLFFSCNQAPAASDRSDSWPNRCCIIPMTNAIEEKDQNKMLKAELTTEASLEGLFRWAAEGMQTLLLNGLRLPEPETIKARRNEYTLTNDNTTEFLNDACEIVENTPPLWTNRRKLFTAYKQWCSENSYRFVSGKKTFFDQVRKTNPGVTEGMHGELRERVLFGIRLNEEGRRALADAERLQR